MPVLKSLAKFALHRAGLLHAVRYRHAAGARILMYHRFDADPAGLAWQCEHIRRYYHPLSLRNLGESMAENRPLPRNSVVVTVDDGYRDFFSYAQPVFRRFGIVATVYLVTDFLDGGGWIWTGQVRYLFEKTVRPSIVVALPGSIFDAPLTGPAERSRAGARLTETLKSLPNAQRLELLARLPALLDVPLAPLPPAEHAPMRWDEVHLLVSEGVEFGAHTRTHPILARLDDDASLADEILGSKLRLEQELNAPVLHFCYPNGLATDIGERALAIVREAGFLTAVTTEPGLNYRTTNRSLLRRYGVEPANPHRYFAEMLAGVRPHGHLPTAINI